MKMPIVLKEWMLYWPVMVVMMTYNFLAERTEYLYFVTFFFMCMVIYDWARLKIEKHDDNCTKDVAEEKK